MSITLIGLYEMLANEKSSDLDSLKDATDGFAAKADDDESHLFAHLKDCDDVDGEAVALLIDKSLLSVEMDEDSIDDDEQGGLLYRTGTYRLLYDGDETGIDWERSSCGYVSHSQGPNSLPGDTVLDLAEGSDSAPDWVIDLVGDDARDYPSISDTEIEENEESSTEDEIGGPDPEEDPDGEWSVVNMDGVPFGTYSSEEDARRAEAWIQHRFSTSTSNLGGAYLPTSIIHNPCGQSRAGQYSTSWYSPECHHMSSTD